MDKISITHIRFHVDLCFQSHPNFQWLSTSTRSEKNYKGIQRFTLKSFFSMEFPKGHKEFSQIEQRHLRNTDSHLIFYYIVYINVMQLLPMGILAQMKFLNRDKDATGVVPIKICFHYSSADKKWKVSMQIKMRRGLFSRTLVLQTSPSQAHTLACTHNQRRRLCRKVQEPHGRKVLHSHVKAKAWRMQN